MEGVSRLEPLKPDAPEISLIAPLVNLPLFNTLTGEHPLQLSFGHSERWVFAIQNKPVGLLIISVIPEYHTGVLEWLFVDEKHRKSGIATRLFDAALLKLREMKIEALSLFFPKNGVDSAAIEALLKNFGWSPSKLFVQKYKFDAVGFNPSWLKREIPIPAGFSLFKWDQITPKERKELEHRIDQYHIPPAVNPFGSPHLIDPKSSVGIRSKERIVGWSINLWIDRDNIEFSKLYIDPELGASGLGIAALKESIRLLQTSPTPQFAWMTIRVLDDPIHSWVNFIKKRLSKEALEIREIHETILMIK